MKQYQVILQPEAEIELVEAFEYIHVDSPNNAADWLRGLYEAIASLETMPERSAFAWEREEVGVDVRQRLYHSHRILFTIEQRRAFVHHIRPAKLDTLKELRRATRHKRRKRKS
jgi:hypothetical protein